MRQNQNEMQMMTKYKNAFYYFVVVFTGLLVTSCTNQAFFNEYQTVEKDGWNKDEVKVFDFESLDTISKRSAYINLRTTNDYPYSNLFLIVRMFPPEGEATVDTLQYQMAKADGTLLGSGFSDIKEHKLAWRNHLLLKKQGVYKVEIEHAMRKVNEVKGDAVLNGITEIGLEVQ